MSGSVWNVDPGELQQADDIAKAGQSEADKQHNTSLQLTEALRNKFQQQKQQQLIDYPDSDLLKASRTIYEMRQGKEYEGENSDLVRYSIDEMRRFNNSWFQADMDWAQDLSYKYNPMDLVTKDYMSTQDEIGMVGYLELMESPDTTPDQKLAFLHLMNTYTDTDMKNWDEAGAMGVAMLNDPSSIGGIGALAAQGFKFLGKNVTKSAIKKRIEASIALSLEGAVFGGGYSYLNQENIIAASDNDYYSQQTEQDYTQNAISAGIGGTFGALLPVAPGWIWDGLGWAVDKTYKPGQLGSGVGPTDWPDKPNYTPDTAAVGPDVPALGDPGMPSVGPDPQLNNAAITPPVEALPAPIVEITPENISVINETSKVSKVDPVAAQQAAQKVFDRHAGSEWTSIEVDKVTASKKANTLGQPVVQFKKIPYGFDKLPEGVTKPEQITNMSTKMVTEIEQLAARAKSGDKAALDVINQATWYQSMRVSLREEFGGMGDLFADLLGATSANTDVRSNWNLSIEAIRRFSNGDFDAEIKAFTDRKNSGEKVDSNTLTALRKTDDFPLITQASGALFGMNSVPATNALLGFFRDIKAGKAPKTINFTGNLIGYSDDATIDVWAARYLRYLTGQSYIPPVAEQGVKGNHLTKSTLQDPVISGEFGFGQDVFKDATKAVNQSGVLQGYGQILGDLIDADLQAIVWFMEKEKWTKNGWTTKAGEGGDMDFEASLAGNPNRDRIVELRKTIDTKASTPEAKAVAQSELDTMGQRLNRTVLGVSGERPGAQPSNDVQADIAQTLHDSIKDDPSMIASKISNTYGRFMKADERALDAEFVTRSDFNPLRLTRALVESGKKYDQDAVFKSKVVKHDAPNARPGLEVYFRNSQGSDKVRELTDRLNKMGVDGFTFVTDARQADRTLSNSGDGFTEASMVGVRLQYIPEFEIGAQEWKVLTPKQKQTLIDERENMFQDIAEELLADENLSSANVVHYDTEVFFRGDYDEFLARPTKKVSRQARTREQNGSTNTQPNSSGKDGQVSPGSVPNGKRGTPKKSVVVKGGAL